MTTSRVDSATAAAAARSLHARAVAEMNRGRPARAIRLSQRALAGLGGATSGEAASVRVRLLVTLGMNQAETSGYAAGEQTLHDARELADALDEPGLATVVSGQFALMAMRAGRMDEALAHFDRALTRLDRAPASDQARVLFNRGAAQLSLGRLAAARADIQRSLAVADEAWLAGNGGKAKHNLGYAEFLAGNLPRALELMAAASREAPHHLGAFDLNRALVLVEAGLTREAGEILLGAEQLFRRQRQWQDVGEVEIARAECALLGGDLRLARRLAASARDRFRRRGSERWLLRAQLLLLQADLADGRPVAGWPGRRSTSRSR